MIGLLSSSTPVGNPVDLLMAAVPISIGLASAAYLTLKSSSQDKAIPTASLRVGDATHDNEYFDDPDSFLKRCEKENGPIFNIHHLNKTMTVVSDTYIREVFMNENFSAFDSINELTGMMDFMDGVRKSNKNDDNRAIHAVVRDTISPNLQLFTPRIVAQLEMNLEKELGRCPSEEGGKFVANPLNILQEMVANAMAHVFVGPEVAKSRAVIDTFITAAADFANVIGTDQRRGFTWRTYFTRANFKINNPLQHHIQVLIDHCTPVILERRRLEAETVEKGSHWERPDDILQKLLDNFDKYNFVDLEDICGHLLLLILASVHTTTDSSTNLMYYFAAFPEHLEKLYEEQQDVLDEIQAEREQKREELKAKGQPIEEDLNPARDRELNPAAVKKMVYMDSYVREVFRFRSERLTLMHHARKDITLSNGMVIKKGNNAIINMRSAHQAAEQGADVTEFRPWRYVGKSKSATKVGTDFLPFGIGRHACPGRFLAIQELKTIGILMVSRYSKIEIEDPTKTMSILLSRIGMPVETGLTFTSRN
ncbi:hypothetical protein BGZ76_001826 [Entomortierella beljakovae]|nr:hypothetical protein BGZ76_001826 [Entomortierella beljakovae]